MREDLSADDFVPEVRREAQLVDPGLRLVCGGQLKLQRVAGRHPVWKTHVDRLPRGPGTSKEPLGPQSQYGKSKAMAEEKALACQSQFPITILRPPSLYGPGDTRFLPLYKAVKRGLVTLPSSQGKASFLHIDDMCHAVISALSTRAETPQVFELDDGEIHEVASLVGLIQGGLSVTTPRLIRVPHTMLWTVAICLEAVGSITGKATLLTRDKMKDLRNPHWVTDSTPFQNATGWKPQISLENGVKETAAWYQEHEWLS